MTDDRELIHAYTIAEHDSVLHHMWALKDQGANIPLAELLMVGQTLDMLTIRWATEHGIGWVTKEDLQLVVEGVRDWLTRHRAELDEMLRRRGGDFESRVG